MAELIVGDNDIPIAVLNQIHSLTSVFKESCGFPCVVLLGGSHRFKYHHEDNPKDIDLFILCNEMDLSNFCQVWDLQPHTGQYENGTTQVNLFNKAFDLTFYHRKDQFDELVRQKEEVDHFLKQLSSSILLRGIRTTGKAKYRLITEAIKVMKDADPQ